MHADFSLEKTTELRNFVQPPIINKNLRLLNDPSQDALISFSLTGKTRLGHMFQHFPCKGNESGVISFKNCSREKEIKYHH